METRSRGREMQSNSFRVIPEFREHIDVKLFCQAIIEIAKSIAEEKVKTADPDAEEPKQT